MADQEPDCVMSRMYPIPSPSLDHDSVTQSGTAGAYRRAAVRIRTCTRRRSRTLARWPCCALWALIVNHT